MAIAFKLPSDEDTDARYEVLHRILMELCELLRTFMAPPGSGEDAPENNSNPRAHRPASDSSLPRSVPDLLQHDAALLLPPPTTRRRRFCSMQQTPPGSPSCGLQHLQRTFFGEAFGGAPAMGDDDVFCPNNASSLTTASSSPPMGVRSSQPVPPRQRRRRRRLSSFKDTTALMNNNQTMKGGNRRVPVVSPAKTKDGGENDTIIWSEGKIESFAVHKDVEIPTTTPIVLNRNTPNGGGSSNSKAEGSLISTILSTSLGGSLWTAVVLVVGWKLLANKR